jgi:hypothetical protein
MRLGAPHSAKLRRLAVRQLQPFDWRLLARTVRGVKPVLRATAALCCDITSVTKKRQAIFPRKINIVPVSKRGLWPNIQRGVTMFDKPNNMVALGRHIWMLRSLNGNTGDFVVMAHSAQIVAKTFEVPDRCQVSYAVYAEQNLVMNAGPVSYFRDKTQSNNTSVVETRQPGHIAPDLALKKVLGRHWSTGNTSSRQDYKELHRHMTINPSWSPNLLLVRNRNQMIGNGVHLSYVIAQAMESSPAANCRFYVWGCRGLAQESRWRLGKQAFQTENTQ